MITKFKHDSHKNLFGSFYDIILVKYMLDRLPIFPTKCYNNEPDPIYAQ